MSIDVDQLPDDPDELKAIIHKISLHHNNQLKEERFKYKVLEEKFKILQHKFFSRKSEKLSEEEKLQMLLFNEAETSIDEESGDKPDKIIVKGHSRKKRGRRPLPDTLPREEVVHDLTDKEKECPCCRNMRPQIGQIETEELDIVPAKIRVIRHIRMKYGPCSCDRFLESGMPEVKTSPGIPRLIPHSIASPGLLAYIVTSKFADSLPFYRQSRIFQRIDVDLSRATMSNWAILAAEKCEDLISLMREEIKRGPLIQMDETTVQVLKEPGRDPTAKSYMWVTVGYPKFDKPIIVFDYRTSRSQNIPLEILEDYEGYLQSDGYPGYNSIGKRPGIIHIGCFAHARRYFHEALTLNKKSNTAQRGIAFIQKLYKIEKELRDEGLSDEEFQKIRNKKIGLVLNEFHAWLLSKRDSVPPETKLGKAIHYTLKEWGKLIRYLDAHFLKPDNNAVEQAIRPFVVGRKNWLFSNTPRGANSSAIIYSLVETAKANKMDPYHYLKHLFEELPKVSSREDLIKLIPSYIQPENFN